MSELGLLGEKQHKGKAQREREPVEIKHAFSTVQECLVRGTNAEALCFICCWIWAFIRGDHRERQGIKSKMSPQVNIGQGLVSYRWVFNSGAAACEGRTHVCASKETLRKVFNSALWQQVLEEQLKHLRSFPVRVLLCSGFTQNSSHSYGYLQLLWLEVWAFLSPCTTLISPASESHLSAHKSCCEFTTKIREQILKSESTNLLMRYP